ncbi:DoxX family protein [Streptomyces sp. NPDC048269]|uniref:DoxX family protein n=1 Tax=Streptomyces sp. NPDC048269 TaxID=3155753 RepID=UPI003430E2EC
MSVTQYSTAPRTATDSTTPYDVGLPVLRVVLGVIMAVHGTQKLLRWFDGPGIKGTGVFFSKAGYPAGETMATVAGLTETLGGLGLILGLLTPLAAAAVVGVMINAISVKWTGAVFGLEGVEFESLIIAAAVTLALTGPGRFALDRFLPALRKHRLAYGFLALALAVVLAAMVLLLRD